MCRIICNFNPWRRKTVTLLVACLFALGDADFAFAKTETKSHLLFPLKTLFSHPKHIEAFEKLGVLCTDCHSFSIKGEKKGPLGGQVKEKYLSAPRYICHQCHFGKVSFPRPNLCQTCHTSAQILKPPDHFVSWRQRHGRHAQVDRDSCAQCHTPQTCDQCHTKLDLMRPTVHRANFRLFHSVEARLNPQSCVMCHRSSTFCFDCHSGKRKW